MDCNTTEIGPTKALSTPGECGVSPNVVAIRTKLFDGLATIGEFATATRKSWRTVYTWTSQGLPVVYIGRTPYIPIEEGRAWLLKPSTRNGAARKPGRPRKNAG